MRRVFRDDNLEAEFQEHGYVKVPFLFEEEIQKLIASFYKSLPLSEGTVQPEDENYSTDMEITYDLTFMDKNPDYKREVFKIISESFQEGVKKYLSDYTPIISNFIPKKPHGGEMPMHQNWAFIDEMDATSVTIWVPLVDCTAKNGTMALVPGSHKRFGKNRGPMIRWELEDIKPEIIENFMIPIEAKAGEAVIIDDSIVHYTDVNKSDNLRLAIQHILIPEEVPSYHYHADLSLKDPFVEVLEVEQDFYMVFNPWKKPSQGVLKSAEKLKYNPFNLSIEEFGEKLYKKRFDNFKTENKVSMLLKSLFS